MAKRKTGPAEGLQDIGPGLTEDGPVQIVRTGSGEAFFRPTIQPRAWSRLDEEGKAFIAALQEVSSQIHYLQGHLEQHVQEAREIGISWDLIGWSVGTTGNAARQRWGS